MEHVIDHRQKAALKPGSVGRIASPGGPIAHDASKVGLQATGTASTLFRMFPDSPGPSGIPVAADAQAANEVIVDDARTAAVSVQGSTTATVTSTGSITITDGSQFCLTGLNTSLTVNGRIENTTDQGVLLTNSTLTIGSNPEARVIAAGTAVNAFNGGTINNDGVIDGANSAIFGGVKNLTIANGGRIEAGDAANPAGRAITWSPLTGEGRLTLLNGGIITSLGTAIIASRNDDVVVNRGRIEKTGNTTDVAIDLGNGDDVYDGRDGGTVGGQIYFGAGNDTLRGGDGAEAAFGGSGADELHGGADTDTLNGGENDDVLDGGAGADHLVGGGGNDFAYYNAGATAGVRVDLASGRGFGGEAEGDVLSEIEGIFGSFGADWLAGDDGANTLNGGGSVFAPGGADDGGNDVLIGRGGSDALNGEGGDDRLNGGAGADTLQGGQGDLDIAVYTDAATGVDVDLERAGSTGFGGTGRSGEAEGDALFGIEGIHGSLGNDTLAGSSADNVLSGGDGADRGHDRLYGRGGKDILDGAGGHDTLDGGADDDKLTGGAGDDVLDGGTGQNTACFSGPRESYSVQRNGDGSYTIKDLRQGPANEGTDTLRNVQFVTLGSKTYAIDDVLHPPTSGQPQQSVLWGTPGRDILVGQALDERIYGLGANDVLLGGSGHDTLFGGAGKDVLTGGQGQDVFVFDTRPNKRTNVDTIRDFSAADDSIQLDNKYLKKLGSGSASKPAKLKAAFFKVADKAKDANDYLVYDRKKGVLYYDEDGSGAKAAIAIAKLANKASLTKNDFFVI